jgi:clan AA aspartic protease (TIGR02281 family)
MNYIFKKASLKLFCVIALLLSLSNFIQAQNVRTKDGVLIGKRVELMESCKQIFDKDIESYSYKGNLNSNEICNCILDSLVPMFNYSELQSASKKLNLDILFENPHNSNKKCQCLNKFYMNLEISSCVRDFTNDSSDGESLTYQQSVNFCSCYIPKLYASGFSYQDDKDVENENSPFYNEIFLPCLNNVVKSDFKNESFNNYVPNDILGGGEISKIQLTDYLGKGFKLKIIINGISQYFLFDTGASIMMINGETERELIKMGALKRSNYLEKKEFSLADGSIVLGQVVKLDNVVIGDYTVNNVQCAIVKNGSLLCGKGFLDKFQKWHLDKENLNLILYK